MFHFLKRHFMMIAAVGILAAGGLYYYHQSHGDNVAIQSQSCSTPCSQCNSNVPVYCDPKTKTYQFWTFGQKACNQ